MNALDSHRAMKRGLCSVLSKLALLAAWILASGVAVADTRVSFVHDAAGRLVSQAHRVAGTTTDAQSVTTWVHDDAGALVAVEAAYPPHVKGLPGGGRRNWFSYRVGEDVVIDPGVVLPPGATIRWSRAGVTLPGENGPTLTIPDAAAAHVSATFAIHVTVNGVESTFTYGASREDDLVISVQPEDVTFPPGRNAVLGVGYSIVGDVSVQWYEVGVGPMSDPTESIQQGSLSAQGYNSLLALGPLGPEDSGRSFYAIVRTPYQEVTTRVATITLGELPPVEVVSPVPSPVWPGSLGATWAAEFRSQDPELDLDWETSADGVAWESSVLASWFSSFDQYERWEMGMDGASIPDELYGGFLRAIAVSAYGTTTGRPVRLVAVGFEGGAWTPADPEREFTGDTTWRSPALTVGEERVLWTRISPRFDGSRFRFRWRTVGNVGATEARFRAGYETRGYAGAGEWEEVAIPGNSFGSGSWSWSASRLEGAEGSDAFLEVELIGFEALPYPVVTVQAEGGTVTLDPEGPSFPRDTIVTATATPDAGREFAGWEGVPGAGRENPLSWWIDGDTTLVAHFPPVFDPARAGFSVGEVVRDGLTWWRLQQQDLPVGFDWALGIRDGSGDLVFTVQGPGVLRFRRAVSEDGALGVEVGGSDAWFEFGPLPWAEEQVTIPAGPQEIRISGTGGLLGWVAVAGVSFSSEGEPQRFTLTRSASGGRIEVSPEAADYAEGTTVQLTAVPDSGRTFSGWTGDLSGTTNPTTLVMSANRTVGALFVEPLDWSGIVPEDATFTTGGAKSWLVQSSVVPAGSSSAAQSGDIDNSEESWFEVNVVGPGVLRFQHRVSSESGYDFLRVRVGDNVAFSASGEVPWTDASVPLPSGMATVRFIYVKDGSVSSGLDTAWVTAIRIEAPPVFVLGPVNPLGLPASTSGDLPWTLQSEVVRPGRTSAARSGAIGSNGLTRFEVQVVGPGTLSYWRRVSSESGYDFLRVRVGDVQEDFASGDVDWTQRSVVVPAGTQAVSWTYSKDGSVNSGLDAAFVDEIRFVPDVPRYEYWPLRMEMPEGGRGMADRHGPLAMPNYLAFVMGVDPRSATPSDLPSARFDPADGTLVFTYRRTKPGPAGTLTVESSGRPSGPWTAVSPVSVVLSDQGTWERVDVRLAPPPGGPLFLRLVATPP